MPTNGEIGAAVFAVLTDNDKNRLRHAIEAAQKSHHGDGMDTWYGDLGNAGLGVPGSISEPVSDQDMIGACARIAQAMQMASSGPGMVDDVDVRAIIEGAFGWREIARIEALYVQAGAVWP
jgi:hypothetical protein